MPVAASVQGQMRTQAMGALVVVRSEQRRAANLHGVKDPPVLRRQSMSRSVTGEAGPENVRQSQRWFAFRRCRCWTASKHSCSVVGVWNVQRAFYFGQVLAADVEVSGRR